MPDLSGQTLGGYRLLNEIGKGGMATVYRAFQPSLERYVAVKVLPAFYAEQDETFLKRFRLEARSIAHLRHPNILTIYEYGEQDGVTFLVMEYVEAGTLTQRLAEGRMTLPAIDPILRQVASALSHAHDQGVVHRDVKPSNILLPKPDWPLLTDFGLAKIIGGSHLTLTGTVAGTPAYMSPEQGRGEEVNRLSDIYSLGIVLYEMCTGAVPFTAETPMAVIVKHIIEPLPLPRNLNPDLPVGVEAVILKALAKQPADRYARADQMADAFHAALEAAAVPVTVEAAKPTVQAAVSPPAKSVEAKPRRRWLLPLAVAGLAGCALMSYLALANPGQRGDETTPPLPSATEPLAEVIAEPTRTLGQLVADGQAKLDAGDPEGAMGDFQAAIAADPSNLDLYWSLVTLLRDYGHPDEARAVMDAAAAVGPDESWFHDTAGWKYYDLGAYPEAVAHFQRAIELDPEAYWSYLGLADAWMAAGEAESARAALDSLTALQPAGEADLFESLGWGYLGLNAYPEAQTAFRQGVTLDSSKTGAWSGLIDSVYAVEGAGAAWNIASEAIAANPADASLRHRLGDLWRELGDAAAAEAEYWSASELDPAYAPAYIALADLYGEQERGDEALAALELGLERNPEDGSLHEAMGQALKDRGEAEAAYAHFSTASDLDPANGWYLLQAALAYYEYSADPAGTEDLLERAGDAGAYDADLLDAIGQVYEAMGDCGSAYGYYARALEVNPGIENAQAGLTRCG